MTKKKVKYNKKLQKRSKRSKKLLKGGAKEIKIDFSRLSKDFKYGSVTTRDDGETEYESSGHPIEGNVTVGDVTIPFYYSHLVYYTSGDRGDVGDYDMSAICLSSEKPQKIDRLGRPVDEEGRRITGSDIDYADVYRAKYKLKSPNKFSEANFYENFIKHIIAQLKTLNESYIISSFKINKQEFIASDCRSAFDGYTTEFNELTNDIESAKKLIEEKTQRQSEIQAKINSLTFNSIKDSQKIGKSCLIEKKKE